MPKPLEPLEAMRLIVLHCEYCNRIQRAVQLGGKDAGLRRRVEAVQRKMFTAMTGRKPTEHEMKWMRFG